MTNDILTASGHYFDFIDLQRNVILIEDIAHGLANLCRFNGHCREFYSVAQHSVAVSRIVPPEFALAGLLHDAAEAYIGDVTKPLKMMLPQYQQIEREVEASVFAAFGLPPKLNPCIKHADLVLLATEQRDLMNHRNQVWTSIRGVEPLAKTIVPMTPKDAREEFLAEFHRLTRRMQ
jgi:5'-deoxynucleotidase YfbR-like HD superfamily hydrolase